MEDGLRCYGYVAKSHLGNIVETTTTCCEAFQGLQHKSGQCRTFVLNYSLPLSQNKGGGRMVQWCWVISQCRGILLIWSIVGQGPTALTVGAGGGCLDIFSLVYHFSLLSPSLWETARYRLKYCLKGPLSPKQQTIQPTTEQTETKVTTANDYITLSCLPSSL